jgi:hypothetical protein
MGFYLCPHFERNRLLSPGEAQGMPMEVQGFDDPMLGDWERRAVIT